MSVVERHMSAANPVETGLWQRTAGGVAARHAGAPCEPPDTAAAQREMLTRIAASQRADDRIAGFVLAKHTPRGSVWLDYSADDPDIEPQTRKLLADLRGARTAEGIRVVPEEEIAAAQAANLARTRKPGRWDT
jgi:hypothetical protein